MLELLKFEVGNRRGAIVGWGIGLTAFAFIYLMFYPQVADQMAAFDIGSIPLYQALGSFDMATFEGYFSSTVQQFFAIIISIFAVTAGTAALAGEEEAGTLELQASLPLTRVQLVMVKAVSLAIAAVLILLVASLGVMLAVWLVSLQTDIDITPIEALPAVWNTLPITLFFLMFSLFLGAYLPSRRAASAAGTVIVIASYFLENLAGMIDVLEPLKPYTPFTYYDSSPAVLTEGVSLEEAAFGIEKELEIPRLAVVSFQRRDLTVGAWPWQRSAG